MTLTVVGLDNWAVPYQQRHQRDAPTPIDSEASEMLSMRDASFVSDEEGELEGSEGELRSSFIDTETVLPRTPLTSVHLEPGAFSIQDEEKRDEAARAAAEPELARESPSAAPTDSHEEINNDAAAAAAAASNSEADADADLQPKMESGAQGEGSSPVSNAYGDSGEEKQPQEQSEGLGVLVPEGGVPLEEDGSVSSGSMEFDASSELRVSPPQESPEDDQGGSPQSPPLISPAAAMELSSNFLEESDREQSGPQSPVRLPRGLSAAGRQMLDTEARRSAAEGAAVTVEAAARAMQPLAAEPAEEEEEAVFEEELISDESVGEDLPSEVYMPSDDDQAHNEDHGETPPPVRTLLRTSLSFAVGCIEIATEVACSYTRGINCHLLNHRQAALWSDGIC